MDPLGKPFVWSKDRVNPLSLIGRFVDAWFVPPIAFLGFKKVHRVVWFPSPRTTLWTFPNLAICFTGVIRPSRFTAVLAFTTHHRVNGCYDGTAPQLTVPKRSTLGAKAIPGALTMMTSDPPEARPQGCGGIVPLVDLKPLQKENSGHLIFKVQLFLLSIGQSIL